MNQSSLTADPALEDLVAGVADEFLERLERGERPEVEEYARRHPPIAQVLRQVLPALQLLRTPTPAAASAPTAELFALAPPGHGQLGDFRILREIGRGGMGVVYEAEQVSLHRRVALKVLPGATALDARQIQRFQNEAQAAAGLHHPHIVPVHFVGCEGGVHYYAMQFIDGPTVAALTAQLRRDQGPASSSAPWPSSRCRPPRRWSTPTRWGSSTATSSRPTYLWTGAATCGSRILAWRSAAAGRR
jgi:hypothetical protein